jgi:hypothetical protein
MATKKRQIELKPKFFSWHQDVALELCIKEYGHCPFGCNKDGAPNCDANVRSIGLVAPRQCEPGRRTVELANQLAAYAKLKNSEAIV